MTRRERMEARAARRLEWAEGREAKSEAAWTASRSETQHLPLGQPILVGHHSEKRHRAMLDRAHRKADQMLEHSSMAEHHRSRAAGIESQLANSIYSDDHDAIERLDEKIAGLEAERDAIKAYNKTVRAGTPDASLIAAYPRLARYVGPGEHFPAFKLTNMGATIRTAKKRREHLARQRAS